MSNNIIQINKHLDEFTKCYICLGKLIDASMCPNCQKLSCQKCIQKWIIERKSQCPHCRMGLKLNQIINVRFINELNTVIETLNLSKQKIKQELCQEHNITLLYFCTTCNESLCSDCFMFETRHKDHKIEKLESIYNNHCYLIKNESKELKYKYDRLNNYLKLINEKIILVRNYKTEKSIELDEVFEKMKTKLENLMHEKLTKLINSKNLIIDKLKYLDDIKNMIETELNEAPKSKLISKSENIIKDIKEIEKEDEMKSDNFNVSLEYPSEIHPPYGCASFVIKNYKSLILQFNSQINNNDKYPNNNSNTLNDVLYSDDLKTHGLTWRLKVYPFGNGAIKGEFISVFLELKDGLFDSSKYFYKIEIENFYKDSNNTLLHSSNSIPNYNGKKTNYWKEFSSDFQNGECWGYNKFYKIEDLEKDGFIDETGKIIFKFYVRAQTYAQLCRDQNNYILSLEKQNQILTIQINKQKVSKENTLENNNNKKRNIYNKNNSDGNISSAFQPVDERHNLEEVIYKNQNSNRVFNLLNETSSKQDNLDLNIKINSEKNLIKIENDYYANNILKKANINSNEQTLELEFNSPIPLDINFSKEKIDVELSENISNIQNPIGYNLNSVNRFKKSLSINTSNNNMVPENNTLLLNNNKPNEMNICNLKKEENLENKNKCETGISGTNRALTENLIGENRNVSMNGIQFKSEIIKANNNTLTMSTENINSNNFENFCSENIENKYNNKFNILNNICEIKNNKNGNTNSLHTKNEDIMLNSQREKINNFVLNNYNIIRNNNHLSSEINNQINSNEKNNNKDYNFNYKSNQNTNSNSLNIINNNNRYSKIANINNTYSNISNLNFNYKSSSQHSNPVSDNINSNQNSTNNFIKGKLLKNSHSIINNNTNRSLKNSNNTLENINKQNIESIQNKDISNNNSNIDKNNDLNIYSSNQNQKLNHLRSSQDKNGLKSYKREKSNESTNNNKNQGNNLENKNINYLNLQNLDISTEIKDDANAVDRELIHNHSEMRISKGIEDRLDQNENPWISNPKTDNLEIENDPIITEINYKDLINKKMKNKLIKCEKLLNEIKVKDDSAKNINENGSNKNSLNYNNFQNINNNNLINNVNNISNINNNVNDYDINGFNKKMKIMQNFEKDLIFNPLEIDKNSNLLNRNLILDISENFSQDNNNANDSLGSLMESMKLMDENSFYDQHILNLQKIKRAKDIFEDSSNNKYKAIKDLKEKIYKEEKTNKDKNSDGFNLYPENQIFNNRQPSPFIGNHNQSSLINSSNYVKRNVDKNTKDPFGNEIFNEKLKKLISKKKK